MSAKAGMPTKNHTMNTTGMSTPTQMSSSRANAEWRQAI